MRNVIIAIAAVTLLVGGVLSLFASSHPDGLEWSIEHTAGVEELESDSAFIESAEAIQEATAFMPDYDFKDAGEEGSGIGTTIAGIVGGAFTFLLAGAAAYAISVVKKRQKAAVSG